MTEPSVVADGPGPVDPDAPAEAWPAARIALLLGGDAATAEGGRDADVPHVDRAGTVGVEVRAPAGGPSTESTLRESVRERVVAVGVPAAAADDLAFEYAPSVWEAREARRRDGRRDGVPSE